VSGTGQARRRRSPPEIERDVLEATLALLARDGYRRLSVDAVAERSGVAKTTIYRHFRNKADLATAALAAFANPQDDPPLPDDPRAALEEHLERFRRRMAAKGMGVLASMLQEDEDPELLELHRARIIRPRTLMARRSLEAGVRSGALRDDVDLGLVIEMAVGSYFAAHLGGRELPPDWASRVTDVLWRGLARSPEAGPPDAG
jgi:AcrR family transcriptional regulator